MKSGQELAGDLWCLTELKKPPFPGSGTCLAATGMCVMENWYTLTLSNVDVHQNKEMSWMRDLPQVTFLMSAHILSGAQ